MTRRRRVIVALAVAIATGVAIFLAVAQPARIRFDVARYSGTLSGGAAYLIEVPRRWNGTIALFSHGFVPPGLHGTASVAFDPTTEGLLLDRGFALAGSAYSQSGYAVEQGLREQMQLLDLFPERTHLHPKRAISWGDSMGGLIAAGLAQRNPHRFQGSMPICGVLGGSVDAWNGALDIEYAFKTLLAPGSPLQLVHITNGTANAFQAERVLGVARGSPAGKARIALVAAILNLPGWFDRNAPEPAADDYLSREERQSDWLAAFSIPFYFGWRQELEARAGGNGSSNAGVNYSARLAHSIDRSEVEALYARARLDLQADVRALDEGPRVAADPAAVDYLHRNIDLDGDIAVPTLTMHTIGDGLVGVSHEAAFRRIVAARDRSSLLRQVFVHRAGHCSFTAAEIVATFLALDERIRTGTWGDSVSPAALNRAALQIDGSRLQPAFVNYSPAPFPDYERRK